MRDRDKRNPQRDNNSREAVEHPADGTPSPEAENKAVPGDPEPEQPEQAEQLPDGEYAEQEPEREPTEEERELAKPVAAVPAGVLLDEIEPVDGFRLPRDQPEAEEARQLADAEARDESRPEVAQQKADDAKTRAEEAVAEAERAQQEADRVKADYDGPDRPPLREGWRYLRPGPDPHEPV
jgi:hypothetical protein